MALTKAFTKELELAIEKLMEAAAAVRAIHEAQDEAFNDRSERWQESEAGEAAMEALDTLDNIESSIQDAADEIYGVINS